MGAATVTIRPSGAGDQTGLTASTGLNYTCVDEASVNDSDYVKALVKTNYDLYALADPAHIGTITKVTVYCRMAKSSGTATGKTAIKTHDTVYYGDEESLGSFTTYSKEYASNPNTGAAWTWDEIDALQAGVYLSDGNGEARCSWVYVEVSYSAGGIPLVGPGLAGPSSLLREALI